MDARPCSAALGILIPEFPTQTHVFFWRQIEALRTLRVRVEVLSTRRPDAPCPHEFADKARSETHYSYPPRMGPAALCLLRTPNGLASALRYIGSLAAHNRRRGLGLLLCAADLVAVARKKNIRHIHCHSCADAAHLVALARRLGGPSYSLHLHGDLDVYGEDHAAKASEATFVAAAASPMEKELVKRGVVGRDRVHTLWMGVDTTRFTPPLQVPAADPLRLVSVGRLDLCKGHRFALEAVRKCLDSGIPLHYTIAGTGPHGSDIERDIARLGLQGAVTMPGAIGENAVLDLLRNSHVFVLTSVGLGEASPVAVMEAMACGLPVVSSIIGGTPEMLRHGQDGFLVPQEDVDAVVEALKLLASPELRSRLGRAARAKAMEKFDARAVAHKLFDQILKHDATRTLQMEYATVGVRAI